jgi:hypothetical protein
LIILVAVAAGLAGYYMGMKKGREEENVSVSKKIPEENKAAPSVASKAPEKETMVRQEIKEPDVREKEDYCAQTENGVQGFFRYLNTKSYVQHLEPGMDTYDHFRRLIQQLSAQPPIPAGEGVDTKIIIKNIFYFSRLLEKKDLMLIKEIMRNEGDTLELNLQMFYKWFMLGD